MSIQRWHPVTDYIGVWAEPDDNGNWVKYEDHELYLDVAYWAGYNAAKAEKE